MRLKLESERQARADYAAKIAAVEADSDAQWTEADYVQLAPIPDHVFDLVCDDYQKTAHWQVGNYKALFYAPFEFVHSIRSPHKWHDHCYPRLFG